MEPTDITVKILSEIRDELRHTRTEWSDRIDATNRRLEESSTQLQGQMNSLRADVTTAIVHSEIRTATAITALGGTMNDIKELLAERLEVRDRVTRCEAEIQSIKSHLALK